MKRNDPKFYVETYDCKKCTISNGGQACTQCLIDQSAELIKDLKKLNPKADKVAVYSEHRAYEGRPALFVVDLDIHIIQSMIINSKFKTLRIFKQHSRIYLVDTNVASVTSGQGFELKPTVNVKKASNIELASLWVHENTWILN